MVYCRSMQGVLSIVKFGVLVGTCTFAVDWLRRSKCKLVIRYCKHSPFFCLLYLKILSNCGYCIGDRSNYNFLLRVRTSLRPHLSTAVR
jgi:hypothetical protein